MDDEWVWDGGCPCLDFVNTLRDRWADGHELLGNPEHFAAWLRHAGLLAANAAAPASEQLREAVVLRESIDRAVRARTGGVPIKPDDIEVINRAVRFAHHAVPELRRRRGGGLAAWTAPPEDPVRAALGALAIDAVELLTAEPSPRVAICASERCGIRFLDRSPARNRQWCSMTRCGNREKARQHYARRKSAQ